MTIQKLKKMIEKNLKISIDFRKDVYITNNYKCIPIMDYKKAKLIIKEAIKIINAKNVNVNIIMDSLKNTTLKMELQTLIFNNELKG